MMHALAVINATMRPAAGIVGAIAHPLQGAWKIAQDSLVKERDQPHRRTRVEEGVNVVKSTTDGERAEILMKFRDAMQKQKVAERKKKIIQTAEGVMYETETLDKKVSEIGGSSASSSSIPTSKVAK